jgi:hypothetical protein
MAGERHGMFELDFTDHHVSTSFAPLILYLHGVYNIHLHEQTKARQ